MEQVNALNATGRSTNVPLAAQALIVVAMLCGRSWQESTGECHAFVQGPAPLPVPTSSRW